MREVRVAGRVHEVHEVFLSFVVVDHGRAHGLDRDAALPLDRERVERVLPDGRGRVDVAAVLEQPLAQAALAVVDVRDDAKRDHLVAGDGREGVDGGDVADGRDASLWPSGSHIAARTLQRSSDAVCLHGSA